MPRFLFLSCVFMALTVKADNLTDPTRPANFFTGTIHVEDTPEDIAEWSLKAIRITPEARIAIVNNKIVRVGDEINLARVLEIHPSSIILDYDNQRLEVSLIHSSIKKVKVSDAQNE